MCLLKMTDPVAMKRFGLSCAVVLFIPFFSMYAYGSPSPPLSKGDCEISTPVDLSIFADKRYLVFAEVHGTNEMPELFAEIVCQFAIGEPVDVAVEWPTKYFEPLNNYISGKNSNQFLTPRQIAQDITSSASPDGRTSEAIVEMIEFFRTIKNRGGDLVLIPFVPSPNDERFAGHQANYEKGLAHSILSRQSLHRRTLVLVGNIHAQKKTYELSAGDSFEPMVTYLPEDVTLTLAPRIESGLAWNCTVECGEHPLPNRDLAGKAYIEVFDAPKSGFDGAWLIGVVTASRPA